jgi:hypothetical protein
MPVEKRGGAMPTVRRRNRFTLIELIVMIAIIAILAAILFPVFAAARAGISPPEREPTIRAATDFTPSLGGSARMSTATTGFSITGGTLPPGTPSSVERQADRDLYDALLRGEFCCVLHARQMGKSSLMAHLSTRLRAAGVG